MKKRNIYRKDTQWVRSYSSQGYRSAPVGGWDEAVLGYEVELLSGPSVRCYIRPEHGVSNSWEAREYATLYAITEAILAAEFKVKRARPKIKRPIRGCQ